LKAYLTRAKEGPFLRPVATKYKGLLDVFLLEKALQELAYEIDNQRASVTIR